MLHYEMFQKLLENKFYMGCILYLINKRLARNVGSETNAISSVSHAIHLSELHN